jgi:hypothetical protein
MTKKRIGVTKCNDLNRAKSDCGFNNWRNNSMIYIPRRKLIVVQLVKKSLVYCGTRWFVTSFPRFDHWFLSTPSQPVPLRLILIRIIVTCTPISPTWSLPSKVLELNFCMHLSSKSMCVTSPAHLIPLHFITVKMMQKYTL